MKKLRFLYFIVEHGIKHSTIRFLMDMRASVSIEMGGAFLIFSLITILSSDVGTIINAQSRLDKLSYSLASIIRERTYIFGSRVLEEKDVEDLYEVANVLSSDTLNRELGMTIEALVFSSNGEDEVISYEKGSMRCGLSDSIRDYKNLSFNTKLNTISNLYRVTLCSKNNDLLLPIEGINIEGLRPISSTIVYGR